MIKYLEREREKLKNYFSELDEIKIQIRFKRKKRKFQKWIQKRLIYRKFAFLDLSQLHVRASYSFEYNVSNQLDLCTLLSVKTERLSFKINLLCLTI